MPFGTNTDPVAQEPDYVLFHRAGAVAQGEFHCSDCGYGVAVNRTLPVCPMCSGESWEQSEWALPRALL
jgi:hypothetical protein